MLKAFIHREQQIQASIYFNESLAIDHGNQPHNNYYNRHNFWNIVLLKK